MRSATESVLLAMRRTVPIFDISSLSGGAGFGTPLPCDTSPVVDAQSDALRVDNLL